MREARFAVIALEGTDIPMRLCEALFADVRDADRVQELVQEATGEPCPCSQGRECPLFGDRLVSAGAMSDRGGHS